ncbi:MAG: hypothetical protein IJ161_01620 [Bacteroidales bacterium]|nr:hypothetical protein [Bacteroidales bacterium]
MGKTRRREIPFPEDLPEGLIPDKEDFVKYYVRSVRKAMRAEIYQWDNMITVERCLSTVIPSLKTAVKSRNGTGWYPLSRKNAEWIAAVMLHMGEYFREVAEDEITAFRKRMMIQEVNITTANALIGGTLEEMGLKYRITPQQYRVMVEVIISEGLKATLYYPYKSLSGKVTSDKVKATVSALLESISVHGDNITVSKTFKNDIL